MKNWMKIHVKVGTMPADMVYLRHDEIPHVGDSIQIRPTHQPRGYRNRDQDWMTVHVYKIKELSPTDFLYMCER